MLNDIIAKRIKNNIPLLLQGSLNIQAPLIAVKDSMAGNGGDRFEANL